MALVIDITLAGTDTNSYVDIAFADSYWEDHFNATKAAAWSALSDPQKTTLLISATRVIDSARFTHVVPYSEYNLHYDYRTQTVLGDVTYDREPCKYYYYQKLQFPRNLDTDPNTGSLYYPLAVQMAVCEQAVYILTFDDSAISARTQGIVSDTLSIGKGQLHVSQQYSTQGSMYCPMAMEMLRPYFVSGSKVRRA